jgi:hypothetical protein
VADARHRVQVVVGEPAAVGLDVGRVEVAVDRVDRQAQAARRGAEVVAVQRRDQRGGDVAGTTNSWRSRSITAGGVAGAYRYRGRTCSTAVRRSRRYSSSMPSTSAGAIVWSRFFSVSTSTTIAARGTRSAAATT